MVIGVVAAISIPSVSSYIDEQHYRSMLKKNYSVLNRAVNLAQIMDNENLKEWGLDSHSLKYTTEAFEVLKKYLNVEKVCGHSDISDCFFTIDSIQPEDYAFRLSDGTSVIISVAGTKRNDGGHGCYCGICRGYADLSFSFQIDVNGDKGPNKEGTDIFHFYLIKDRGLLPCGADWKKYNNCRTNPSALDCAAAKLYNWI